MGRVTRRRWAPLYLHGLIGPDGRKSLQPLAARLGLGGHDQLQHFIASPAWDDEPLRRVLAGEADALVGGPGAVLVVDDTALPKKGERSVGVARQYCGALGKRANCQTLVSLTLARGEVPLPLGLRLFLPDEWAADPGRCARAGVPEEHRRALAKPDLALAEIDRVIAAGVRFGRVLADAGYGASAAFRQGLSVRRLAWAVGILKTQNVYPAAVELLWPKAARGRPRKHPVPSEAPVSAEAMLAGAPGRRISWRHGTKGPPAAEFAALRVRPLLRSRPRPCWRVPRGAGSAGGTAPRVRSRPSSPPCECARPRASGSATAGACPGTRSGWSASTARAASASTTSPTCRRRPRSRSWRRRSRRAGCASRRTSSSRRSAASTTSRAAPGPACTGTP